MNHEIVRVSRDVLSTHARSFKWASWFLPADRRDDAAVVYAFCRLVDDLADEAPNTEYARVHLDLLAREVVGEAEPRPIVGAFHDVSDRRGLDLRYAQELIEGVLSDLDDVRIASDSELLRYCYRVAGTVGLMMCAVLGVSEEEALPHAIDLGVGMQLTNIARDVLEDAQRGRAYLPASRLRRAGVSPDDVLAGTADRAGVAQVVSDILDLAEAYYRSADAGMHYIPARSRMAILVAARLYRGIGIELRKKDCDALGGRTWVSWPGKLAWIASATGSFFTPRILGFDANERHDSSLHRALQGLPGVSR